MRLKSHDVATGTEGSGIKRVGPLVFPRDVKVMRMAVSLQQTSPE